MSERSNSFKRGLCLPSASNNAKGYTTNLRGTVTSQREPDVDVLAFLPNISRRMDFKINGLAVSEIYVDGREALRLSELNNISGEDD